MTLQYFKFDVFRIFSMLMLTHFKPMFHFYTLWKYQEGLAFWCLRELEMEQMLNKINNNITL